MKSLHQCRSGKDFVAVAEHAARKNPNVTVRNGAGSHVIVSTPKGAEVVPCHNGDLGKGLRSKLVKAFLALGIASVVLLVAIIQFRQGVI